MAQDMNKLLRELAVNDPQEFKRLIAMAQKRVIRPHSGQQVVLDSKARYRVMNCGRRWGKTVLASHIFATKARKPGQMLWWVAPTYKVTKRGYAEVLKRLPEGVLAKPAPPESNFDAGRSVILHFKNGTKMEFYSAERPEGMLGAAVDFCVMDEAAIMPGHIWNQVVAPTLIDHDGGALMISTPRGKNWFYKVWLLGQDPDNKLWDSWTFPTQSNPYLPDGAADEMAKQIPRMEAQQEIYAKWIAEGQNVFIVPEISRDPGYAMEDGMVWDVDEFGDPEKPRTVTGAVFLGVDLGRTNDYTVLYGTREIDRRNVYFTRFSNIKWEEQRRRIKRAVGQLMRAGASHVLLVIDEGNGGTIIKEDMEDAGFAVEGINFTSHKQNMVRLLATDLEVGHAFVLESAQFHEFENYAMTQTARGVLQYSAPEGEHDDVVSAKLLSHWGCVNMGEGDVQLVSVSDREATELDFDNLDDPWDAPDDDGLDLLDDDAAAAAAVGLDPIIDMADPWRVPPPEELMRRTDIWF